MKRKTARRFIYRNIDMAAKISGKFTTKKSFSMRWNYCFRIMENSECLLDQKFCIKHFNLRII